MRPTETIFIDSITDAIKHILANDFGQYIDEIQAVRYGAGHYSHMQLFYRLSEVDKPSSKEKEEFEKTIDSILDIEDKTDGYWSCLIWEIGSTEWRKWKDDLLLCWRKEKPDEITFEPLASTMPRFIATDSRIGEEFIFGLNDLYAFDTTLTGIGFKGRRNSYLSLCGVDGIVEMNPDLSIRLVGEDAPLKGKNAVAEALEKALKHIIKSEFAQKYITGLQVVDPAALRSNYVTIAYLTDGFEQPTKEEAFAFNSMIEREITEQFPLTEYDTYMVVQKTDKIGFGWQNHLIDVWDSDFPEVYHADKVFVAGLLCREYGGGLIGFSLEELQPVFNKYYQGIEIVKGTNKIKLSENSIYGYFGMSSHVGVSIVGKQVDEEMEEDDECEDWL